MDAQQLQPREKEDRTSGSRRKLSFREKAVKRDREKTTASPELIHTALKAHPTARPSHRKETRGRALRLYRMDSAFQMLTGSAKTVLTETQKICLVPNEGKNHTATRDRFSPNQSGRNKGHSYTVSVGMGSRPRVAVGAQRAHLPRRTPGNSFHN